MIGKPQDNLTSITISGRTWLALGLTVTISLTFAGILTVALGMPLAWRIDRASYQWAVDDYYELPSYETREATPAEVDPGRSLP